MDHFVTRQGPSRKGPCWVSENIVVFYK